MGAAYQLGNTLISKSFILGWVLTYGETQVRMVDLSDEDLNKIKCGLPAYMEDFALDVMNEISARKVLADKAAASQLSAPAFNLAASIKSAINTKPEPQAIAGFSFQPVLDYNPDSYAKVSHTLLTGNLFTGVELKGAGNHVYTNVRVTQQGVVVATPGGAGKGYATFKNLDEAIKFITNRWW
jgi:hypothetical protein